MILSPAARPWVPLALMGASVAGLVAALLGPIVTAAMLAPLCGALVLLNPASAIPLLLISSALNRVALPWGDAQIRLEIVVVLLLAAVVCNRIAVRTVRLDALRSGLVPPLVAYFASNLLSTLLFAEERTRGLKLDAEIFAAALTYLVFTSLLRSRSDLERAIAWLWIVTVGEAALGLVLFAMYVSHVGSFGVIQGDFGLPMVYATQWEANIFGSFLLGNFFLLLADYLRRPTSALQPFGLLVVVLGIAVSMTRTVWLGLFLGAFVFLLTTMRTRARKGMLLPIMAAAPIVALAGLVVGSATPLAGRLLDVVNLQSSSGHGRLLQFQAALADWKQHPVLGSGTGSFNFYLGSQTDQPHPWLANIFLLALHDTGIVGLAILLWLLVAFYRMALRGLAAGGDLSLLAAGATAGFTSLLFAFQTTTGFWFAYPWIVAGIAACITRLSELDR